MKLSESGKSKFWNLFYVGNELSSNQIECIDKRLRKIDFQEEDFVGCVVLTTEEASGIFLDLRDFYKQTYGYEWVKNEPWFAEFKKRIEQAQSGNTV